MFPAWAESYVGFVTLYFQFSLQFVVMKEKVMHVGYWMPHSLLTELLLG